MLQKKHIRYGQHIIYGRVGGIFIRQIKDIENISLFPVSRI